MASVDKECVCVVTMRSKAECPCFDCQGERMRGLSLSGVCVQDVLTAKGAAPILKPKPPLDRARFLAEFKEITEKMLELTGRKNNDYGGPVDPLKNFRKHGEYGIVVRMDDKMSRLDSFFAEKRALEVKDESIEDTAMDLAVYAIILLIMSRDNRR